MSGFVRARVIAPIVDLIKRGVTPEKLALSIAIGAMLGIFPFIGATMILCAVAGHVLRLNHIALQAVNYAVYPVQIVLLVPFVRLGEWILSAEAFPVTPSLVLAMLNESVVKTLLHFWTAILHAILGWGIAALPAGLSIYILFLPLLRRSAEHYRRLKERHSADPRPG